MDLVITGIFNFHYDDLINNGQKYTYGDYEYESKIYLCQSWISWKNGMYYINFSWHRKNSWTPAGVPVCDRWEVSETIENIKNNIIVEKLKLGWSSSMKYHIENETLYGFE